MARDLAALFVAASLSVPIALAQTEASEVYVSVVDEGGKAVSGLAQRDFVLEIDGASPLVLDVRPATEPLSLVVIADDIDVASSQQARTALRTIITSVRARSPNSRVGLMVSEGATTPRLLNVTDGAAALDRTVTRFVQSGGAAPLLESIVVATDALAQESTRRRAVLAVTRQVWADTSVTPRRIADALQESGAALWAIEIWPTSGRLAVGREEDTVMREVTRLSGGRRERIFDSISLEATAKRMVDALLSQYVVTYAARPASGPGELRVGVRRGGVKVFAPGWAHGRP
jgi:hypothetical protein